MNALTIYTGSDGEATKGLYAHLETFGPIGVVALNLFRAQKASSRAKVYRGGGFKGKAYEKKNWSLGNLCKALQALDPAHVLMDEVSPISSQVAEQLRYGNAIQWGWKIDPAQEFHNWVLYVELPTGQVSFHSARPLCDRRYTGEWDGQHLSAERICRFVQMLLDQSMPVSTHATATNQ